MIPEICGGEGCAGELLGSKPDRDAHRRMCKVRRRATHWRAQGPEARDNKLQDALVRARQSGSPQKVSLQG